MRQSVGRSFGMRWFILGLLVVWVLPSAGCGGSRQETDRARTFLERFYTCPDEAYLKAREEEMKQPAPAGEGDNGIVALKEENSPTLKWMADRYKSMFTDAAYTTFVSQNAAFRYQQAAGEARWTFAVKRQDIRFGSDGKYTYDVTVLVTDAQSKKTERRVSGTLEFDEAGKIRWFKEYEGLMP